MGRNYGTSGASHNHVNVNAEEEIVTRDSYSPDEDDLGEASLLLPGIKYRLLTVGGGDRTLTSLEPVHDATAGFRWLSWLLSKFVAFCRLLLKPTAFAAVLREPLFSLLMFFALVTSIKQIITFFIYRGGISNVGNIFIQAFAALLAIYNLTNDWISVSPADAVDSFLNSTRDGNIYLYMFKTLILFVAVILSFPVGSCSDALALSIYINNIGNDSIRNIVKYALLSIIILLGEVYYAMLSNSNLQSHSKAFFAACTKYRETFQWIKENSLEFIEAMVIILCNALYRPALFGSIAALTISEYIGANSTSLLSKFLIGVVMIATGITTIFARSLGIFRTIVPAIAESERDKSLMTLIDAKLSPLAGWSATKHVLATSVFPIIRGLGVGLIAFALLERETIPSLVQAIVATSLGVFIFGLSFFTQFRSLVRTLPTPQLQSDDGPIEITIEAPSLNDGRHTAVLTAITYQDALAGFERLQKDKENKTPGLSTFVTHVDITTRFARCLSMPAFLLVLFLTFDIMLTATMLAGITLVLSAGVAQSESSLYRPAMRTMTTGVLVKMDLQATCDEQAGRAPATTVIGSFCDGMRRFGLAMWHSGPALYQRAYARPAESGEMRTVSFEA